ncbi:MAG: HIT family protein [Hyphomicrobiales bacterium]|nr:HIT family protein [Hyphomicrobiales bacterium]
MTDTPAYDDANVFARILRGELPAHKIYEDERTLAFMDIMPRAAGHALVIPKAPARNILDAAPDDLAAVIAVTQKVAKAAKTAFGADGVSVHQFSEKAGGQEVFHLHFHVIPRRAGEDLGPAGVMGDQAAIAERAQTLRDALARI